MSVAAAKSHTAWPFAMRPLSPALGVEVIGVDFAKPIDAALFASIHAAFLRHQLLLFRGQDVPPARQVELARCFGEVQIHVMNQYHADGHPELYRLSNLDENGNPSGQHPDRGTMAWHTDGSWQRRTGLATILYAEIVPTTGGGTKWADMYGAYDALTPQWHERLAGLRAMHNLDFSRNRRHGEQPMTEEQKRKVPPVDHPIVRTHPETGRKCLYLGDHGESIVGMSYDEGRALIEEINAMSIRPELVYEHRWQPRDLMIWDNRCTLHQALPYDEARERRVIRRCTVIGDVPR
jgi:taurine dioxygenase